MRLGILGGTFNPIHEGHIRTADYFTETLSLDKVLLVPAKTPPHKETPDLATGRDRYNMCALAARAYPQLEACETELSMGEPSYTINTLEEILEEYPGANLFLLMGSDMFLTVQDWHRYDDIKELATICAVARDQGEKEDLLEHGRRLQAGGAEVFVGDMSPFPISSTEIRRKIFEGESTDRVLNGQERRYIDGLGLYKGHNNSFIQYDALVEKMEKPRRAFHSHCVASESARLAAMYGADVQKAYIAGLLHDILHNVSSVDMLQMVNDSDILLSSDQKEFPAVWHGILGAAWLKQEGIVSDEEILSAISHHTVGGSGMDTLDKVVFCADKTSLDRDYEDVWDARERVDESLNDGFQYIISYNIRSLLEHEESILKETWEAYNENVSALQKGE